MSDARFLVGTEQPFGRVDALEEAELAGRFAAAPEHPLWLGLVQLANEQFEDLQRVVDDPVNFSEVQRERALGAMQALRGLFGDALEYARRARTGEDVT